CPRQVYIEKMTAQAANIVPAMSTQRIQLNTVSTLTPEASNGPDDMASETDCRMSMDIRLDRPLKELKANSALARPRKRHAVVRRGGRDGALIPPSHHAHPKARIPSSPQPVRQHCDAGASRQSRP